MSKLTPMMKQYQRIKSQNEDKLVFFRLGDFYELFMDDAETAARELEITLTGRDIGGGKRVPMCGVPHHAADTYIARLVEQGYRVAICEQVEDPREARGIVRREIVRVVTPGTVTDLQALKEKVNNYIVALAADGTTVGLSAADVSTGEFRVTQVAMSTRVGVVEAIPGGSSELPPWTTTVLDELHRYRPSEIIVDAGWNQADGLVTLFERELGVSPVPYASSAFGRGSAREALTGHFGTPTLQPFGCDDKPAAVRAAGGLLRYLLDTQLTSLQHITALKTYSLDEGMVLDATTRRNLELTERIADRSRKGSLLGVLDHTVTAMGGRLLKQWVERPLVDVPGITRRLNAVEALVDDPFLRADMVAVLRDVYDIERLTARAAYGSANPRELASLRQSLQALPRIRELLSATHTDALGAILERLDPLSDLTGLLENALQDDPPAVVTDGGIIREGYHAEVDELRQAQQEGTDWIATLQEEERKRTGIKSLKVGFNKVFGYYIEVTRANLELVPEDYDRKQTLANSERYITPELKEKESLILGAEDRLGEVEYAVFVEVRERVAAEAARLRGTAAAVAELDALLSLALAAVEGRYVRPVIDSDGCIDLKQSRHPVLEQLQEDAFVPNDCYMDTDEHRLLIITGPNMAGKSTFMRQVALVTLMAQLGSFVPADAARVGLVDRIFSRVGASDDLSRGQSTFMVEMVEVSHILRHASERSLVILDEVGRGTSTFDGMALAQAIVEHLHRHVGARTLCSTHYHELTSLAEHETGIQNLRTEVAERGEDVVFLYQVKPGRAERSYGINVARLAQLPVAVIERAKELLKRFEEDATLKGQVTFAFLEQAASSNTSETRRTYQRLLDELGGLELVTMSPLDVMNWAYDFQRRVQRVLAEQGETNP